MNRKTAFILGAIGIVVAGAAGIAFCLIVDWHEHYQRTLPERQAAEREERLNRPVRGYVTEKDLSSATLKVTTVEYYGGYVEEVGYADGKLVYRQGQGIPDTSVQGSPVDINDEQKELLLDILNLICKKQLWNQGDELPSIPVADGGEVAYKFAVKDRQGQFKVVNAYPKHLEVFQYKCWRLLESCKPKRNAQAAQ